MFIVILISQELLTTINQISEYLKLNCETLQHYEVGLMIKPKTKAVHSCCRSVCSSTLCVSGSIHQEWVNEITQSCYKQ